MDLLPQAKRIIDQVLSKWIRPEDLVLKEWRGQATPVEGTPKRLCLFSHFDRKNEIAPYVLNYLRCLKKLNADVVFITTCEQFSDAQASLLLSECIYIIHRKNISLDFGSWKLGLSHALNLRNYDQLILANDSVYGPFFPLEPIFEKMDSRKLDLWGMTSNLEKKYHIQSYFLVFSKNAFLSPAFAQFWEKFRYYRSKARIIAEYELGLSELAQKEGWNLGAFVEHSQVTETELNPTLFFWDVLIEKFQFPFLKTEVLRLNRTGSPRVNDWKEILRAKSSYNSDLISTHLAL